MSRSIFRTKLVALVGVIVFSLGLLVGARAERHGALGHALAASALATPVSELLERDAPAPAPDSEAVVR